MDPRTAFAQALAARRVVARFLTARDYKEYVEEKKQKGEKPLDKAEWEARTQGGGKEEEGAKPLPMNEKQKKVRDDIDEIIDDAYSGKPGSQSNIYDDTQKVIRKGRDLIKDHPKDHPQVKALSKAIEALSSQMYGTFNAKATKEKMQAVQKALEGLGGEKSKTDDTAKAKKRRKDLDEVLAKGEKAHPVSYKMVAQDIVHSVQEVLKHVPQDHPKRSELMKGISRMRRQEAVISGEKDFKRYVKDIQDALKAIDAEPAPKKPEPKKEEKPEKKEEPKKGEKGEKGEGKKDDWRVWSA